MKSQYLFTKIFITGGITLGLELVSSCILTPFFGVSLFVWSSILAITLIALALGYRFGGVVAVKLPREKILVLFAAAGGIAALWLDLCLWTYPYLFWPLSSANLVLGSIAACIYLLFVPLLLLSGLNPLLVSLMTGDRAQGDHGAGNVFFISTIGSVLGVFIVAYGMLPYLTNYQTVVVLALLSATLSLVLMAKIWDANNRLFKRLFALTALAFIVSCVTLSIGGLERFTGNVKYKGFTWHVVEAQPSSFGHLHVVEFQSPHETLPRRALLNDGMVQNMFDASGQSAALYSYALERLALATVPDPHKALVLGIGAGIVPMAFAQDGMEVQAIDINAKMVNLAHKYFEFQPDDFGIKVDLQDARIAVRHCQPDHDVVAVDLFRDDGIPEHLVTQEFFSDIKNCMADQGVMVMNTFVALNDTRAEHSLVKTIASVFGEVYYVEVPPETPGDIFTIAYLVARKGGPVGKTDISVNGIPARLAEQFTSAIKCAKILKPDSNVLKDGSILTDVSNQWKHLAYNNELAYRQQLISKMPWQILMN